MRVRHSGDSELTQQETIILRAVEDAVASFRDQLAARGIASRPEEIRWPDSMSADCIVEFYQDGEFLAQVDFPAISHGLLELDLDELIRAVSQGIESQFLS